MGTVNYTTTIDATRTIGEIQAELVKHGATHVTAEFTDGAASGLGVTVTTPHGPRQFRLPVDIDAMRRLLAAQDKAGKLASAKNERKGYYTTREHAEKVAWRVIKDWLTAQLALIDGSPSRGARSTWR